MTRREARHCVEGSALLLKIERRVGSPLFAFSGWNAFDFGNWQDASNWNLSTYASNRELGLATCAGRHEALVPLYRYIFDGIQKVASSNDRRDGCDRREDEVMATPLRLLRDARMIAGVSRAAKERGYGIETVRAQRSGRVAVRSEREVAVGIRPVTILVREATLRLFVFGAVSVEIVNEIEHKVPELGVSKTERDHDC